jgi:hypothetical protein
MRQLAAGVDRAARASLWLRKSGAGALSAVALAASVVLPLVGGVPAVAGASSLSTLMAGEAQMSAAELATAGQIHLLASSFDAMVARVAADEAATVQAEQQLGRARSRLAAAQVAMRSVALQEYTTGGIDEASLAVFSARPGDLAAREEYLSVASEDQARDVALMRKALAGLDSRERSLAEAQNASKSALVSLALEREALAQRLAAENALVSRYQAEIASARAAAYAAKQAELARFAQEAGPPSHVAFSLVTEQKGASLAEDFARLRECESGDNYQDDTGNGYYGAYQFSLPTWQGLGYSGLPSAAPPPEQDQAAYRLYQQSGWSAWPACSAMLGL